MLVPSQFFFFCGDDVRYKRIFNERRFLKYFPFGLLLISIFLIELFTIFNSDQLPFNDIDAINIKS